MITNTRAEGRRWLLFSGLVVTASLLSGCALPGIGLDTGGFTKEESPYEGAAAELQPVLRQVTPGLVANLQEAQAADEQASLEAVSEVGYEEEYSDYRVGPGDILSVIVWGHPDLTNPTGSMVSVEGAGRLVHADGTMFFPYVGTVKVAGRTVIEIRRLLADGLKSVIREPQVDVRVLQYRSKHAFVVGNVGRPCRIAITDQPLTVIDALNKCQSLSDYRRRQRIPAQTVKIIRGREIRRIDLDAVYLQAGGPGIELQDGDRVYVEDDTYNRVFVVGEFTEQRAVQVPISGLTLGESISQSGGLNLETADAGGIYVIRGLIEPDDGERGKLLPNLNPVVYHLDASSAEAFVLADQFPLAPRDVVFASSASLVNFNRALSQLVPTVLLLAQGRILVEGP